MGFATSVYFYSISKVRSCVFLILHVTILLFLLLTSLLLFLLSWV